MSYSDEKKEYSFYYPIIKKFIINCDVVFYEKNKQNWDEKQSCLE